MARREFFRLLSHSAKGMLFIGRDHFKFFCAVQVMYCIVND